MLVGVVLNWRLPLKAEDVATEASGIQEPDRSISTLTELVGCVVI